MPPPAAPPPAEGAKVEEKVKEAPANSLAATFAAQVRAGNRFRISPNIVLGFTRNVPYLVGIVKVQKMCNEGQIIMNCFPLFSWPNASLRRSSYV